MVKDEHATIATTATSATRNSWESYRKQRLVLTANIAATAQKLIEVGELDISSEHLTTNRVGRVLTKMRLVHARQGSGKRGWMVSLEDVARWARSYGLDPSAVTGVKITPVNSSGTSGTSGTSGIPPALDLRGLPQTSEVWETSCVAS